MRFDAPAAGIWKIRVYHTLSIQGEYHMWLPVHGFISDETFFLRPDPDTIITDPGNTAAIITTAAYSHQTGGIYLHSSRGFTRTGAIKPDLAAPGVRILTTAPGGTYAEATGTSFATPFVTGASALLMEWGITKGHDPYLYGEKAIAYLKKGTRSLPAFSEYPNPQVGWGALCIKQSLPEI